MTEKKQKEIYPVIRSFCPKEQYREVCNIDLETPCNLRLMYTMDVRWKNLLSCLVIIITHF